MSEDTPNIIYKDIKNHNTLDIYTYDEMCGYYIGNNSIKYNPEKQTFNLRAFD